MSVSLQWTMLTISFRFFLVSLLMEASIGSRTLAVLSLSSRTHVGLVVFAKRLCIRSCYHDGRGAALHSATHIGEYADVPLSLSWLLNSVLCASESVLRMS